MNDHGGEEIGEIVWNAQLRPGKQFRRVRAGAEPRDRQKGRGLVRPHDDRPLTAFAGIWTVFKGDRGTKSKPIPGPHPVYGFLTTARKPL
jgi:hypothetical protein